MSEAATVTFSLAESDVLEISQGREIEGLAWRGSEDDAILGFQDRFDAEIVCVDLGIGQPWEFTVPQGEAEAVLCRLREQEYGHLGEPLDALARALEATGFWARRVYLDRDPLHWGNK